MEDFIYTAQKAFRKYKIEIILIGLAFLITVISGAMYMQQSSVEKTLTTTNTSVDSAELRQPTPQAPVETAQKMYVYLSGSVKNPDVYEITTETRLKHVFEKAGGLSDQADITYFSQYINLAKKLQDQEKIYIPSVLEVANGFIEQSTYVAYAETDNNIMQNSSEQESSSKININTASLAELEELPSVGAVTAQKIIDNRPYTTVGELLDKKVVSQSLFDKIVDLIE